MLLVSHPKQTSNDLVSVCIPTYNCVGMLSDAIRSAREQTYTNLEILVVDNCSTDATQALVKVHAAADRRVKYFRQSMNVGMAGNFNTSLSMAAGDLVMILCSDDFLERDCVESLATRLRDEPAAVLAACGRTFVDEELHPIRVVRARSKFELVPGEVLISEFIRRGNVIGEPSAVLFRRKDAERGFNEEFKQFLDLELWIHLLSQGSAALLPDALCRIRQHAAQATQSNFRSGRLVAEKRQLFSKLLARTYRRAPSFACKASWDVRMVVSVARVRCSGGECEEAFGIREVFHRWIFLPALLAFYAAWPLLKFVRLNRRR